MVDNAIFELKNIDASTHPEKDLRELARHLQHQMDHTYVYWVGEWAGAKHAKNTRNGHFASKEEVIGYLNGAC